MCDEGQGFSPGQDTSNQPENIVQTEIKEIAMTGLLKVAFYLGVVAMMQPSRGC